MSQDLKGCFLLFTGKDNVSSSTENAFLTQMLQSSSPSGTLPSISSSMNIPSFLRKGDFSSSSHRTVTSTLTNILPALLNGTLKSPRAISPSSTLINVANLNSPTSTNTTDTLVDIKCSTSLPVSPIANMHHNNLSDSSSNNVVDQTSCSPPRCRSYPTAVLSKQALSPTSTVPSTSIARPIATSTSCLLAAALSCPSLTTSTMSTVNTMISSTSSSPDDTAPKIVRSASVKSCASDSGVSSSSPLSDNNIVHVNISYVFLT
jgi:hypothetical protein